MSLEIGEIKSKEDAERVSEIALKFRHRNTLGINSTDLNSSLSYQTR